MLMETITRHNYRGTVQTNSNLLTSSNLLLLSYYNSTVLHKFYCLKSQFPQSSLNFRAPFRRSSYHITVTL